MLNRRQFLTASARPTGLASPDSGRPDSGRYWMHLSRQAMACRFEATLPLREREGVHVARAALDEVDRLERELSVFKDSSRVSYINRYAFLRPVLVDKLLFDLLMLSRRLHRETGGAFD